ncbi:MAG: histidine kinase [Burkholderiaceae bacterium]|nr:histidine kinase [Burkholderiaceae bacterium]
MPRIPAHFSPQQLARHAFVTAVFCCIVASAMALSTGRPWDRQLVYSLGTGMTSWAVIDFGRYALRHGSDTGWPSGWRGPVLVVAGILAGFLTGTAIGDAYCGCASWEWHSPDPQRLMASLMITLAAGVIAVLYFYGRGKATHLQARIALVQRDAAEARLKLLETQLEPHMLFNTLANLRVLVASDPARAQVMLDHLIAYLRATLSASRASTHTLQTEFDRLRDYLELMAVRMGPRLRFTFELPPELATLSVPPLLLQPLVENSIKHGLEPQVEGGAIHIAARRLGQSLELTVEDTGAGMSPATQSPKGSGFGLAQVRERLATVYGAASTLDVTPGAAGGTRVAITLPVQA